MSAVAHGQHSVAGGDLTALATGRGGAEAIRLLTSGQLSKRLLCLLLLGAHTAGLPAGDASAFNAGYELAIEVQQRDPMALATVLLYPSVGNWLSGCLRRLRRGTERPARADLGQLAAVAAAAAVRAGHDFEIKVPALHGGVMLPTLGMASLAAADGGADVIVRRRAGEVELVTGGGAVLMPADPEADGAGWQGLRRLRVRTDGHLLTCALDDVDPARGGPGLPIAGRITPRALSRWQSVLADAWELLVTYHPCYADGIGAGLSALVPLAGQPGRDSISATSQDAFGACCLSEPPDAESLAVTLIHEFQHSKLGALHDIAPLYLTGPDVRFYSPWRDDPRPMSGLLHGAYAYLGITDFWRTQRGIEAARRFGHADFAHFEFARWRAQTLSALRDIVDTGQLTQAGRHFASDMRQTLLGWRGESVPAGPRAAARDAISDHRVSWRLRNLRPDDRAVSELARDWLAGRSCDQRESASAVVRTGRALTRNARMDLLFLRLKHPEQFAAACAGGEAGTPCGLGDAEIAYAQGEKVAALARYQEIISAHPDNQDAWAGQAISGEWPASSSLVRRPELVYALHRKIRDAGADAPGPAELASWLDVSVG